MLGSATIGDVSVCKGRVDYANRISGSELVSVQMPLDLDVEALWRLCRAIYDFCEAERRRDLPNDWRGRE